jgi:hypothetical protein
MTPFDFVNAINSTNKINLIETAEDKDLAEKEYIPFVVNRALSYFPDTLMYANAMNLHNFLPSKLQNDYLLNSVRPAKRFSKWAKTEDSDILEAVKTYYGYSREKAKQILPLLSQQQISIIKKELEKGGMEDGKS